MTETKFTHVPWIVLDQTIMSDQEYEDLYNCQNHARLETIWNGKEIIAEVCAWDDRITEKSLSANAHLIAAAPELYNFVEEYLEAWENGMAGDSYLFYLAQAVLGKARGEA